MTINDLFNETDLYIFCRQNNFSFNDFCKADDGTVCALDRESGQVFIGKDLFKHNVHEIASVLSVGMEDDGTAVVTFMDSSVVRFPAESKFLSELIEVSGNGEIPASDQDPALDPVAGQETDVAPEPADLSEEVVEDPFLTETYTRLLNTDRSKTIAYLVSDTGMSVEEACRYVDDLMSQEVVMEEENGEWYRVPDFNDDGTMTRDGIMRVVRSLSPGDMIHLEYKPFIGKLRVFDAEYMKLRVDVDTTRYFSMCVSGADYDSLLEDIVIDLFEYFEICFIHPSKYSECSCGLSKIRLIRKVEPEA